MKKNQLIMAFVLTAMAACTPKVIMIELQIDHFVFKKKRKR